MARRTWMGFLAAVVLLVLVPAAAARWREPVRGPHSGAGTERMPWLVGDTLYLVINYDIYQSKWVNGQWTKPEPVPGDINTAANEINPCVVRGGTVMYFARYSKETNYDFYRSEWDAEKQRWSTPVLVWEFNTPDQEWDIWVSEDESVAYFTSRGSYGGQASRGGQDIWKSVKVNNEWSTPTPLTALNTSFNEWSVFVDKDGKIYFDSDRPGGRGSYDVWVAESDAATPYNLGEPFNTAAEERSVAISDKFFFVEAKDRQGGVKGYDLWYAVAGPEATVQQGAAAQP